MDKDYKYKFVTTWAEVHKLVDYCKQTGYCSSDFESSGTNAMYPGSYPTILGVSFQPGGAWVLPLAHKESPFKKDGEWRKVLRYFGREVIENKDIVKIGQNVKFEIGWWKKYGITMRGRVFDTMLAKYLLDEERPHGLKDMVSRFLPEFDGYDLPGQPGKKATTESLINFWSNVPIQTLSKYCALDSDLTFRLYLFFERRLIDHGFYPLFRNMLMMASHVLAEGEYRGMDIDVEYLSELMITYREKIDDCEERLRNIPEILRYEQLKEKSVKKQLLQEIKLEIEDLKENGGSEAMIKNREKKISVLLSGNFNNAKEHKRLEPTNFGSPAQMIDLLFESPNGFEFDVVKFTEDKKTKKQTNRPSTDESVLLELKNYDNSGFIDTLLELRELSKMYSTYVKGMWEKVNSKGTVHGSFLLHGTVTGRLSSRSPNLQNIPRDTTASDIKRMFIAPPGKLLFQLDYSQAELRVLAAAAKETTMIEWFKTGKDVHLASACLKWDKDYDQILKIYQDESHPNYEEWKIKRKQAKTINFGIVYGQTAKKLAGSLSTDTHQVSLEEAQEFLNDFDRQFPRIKKFIKTQKKFAETNGYVYNLFGRKRRLPNIYSDKWGLKAEAERQSVNAPIQAAASDFTLFSSILIREHILLGDLPQSLQQVGTVHDSLIFYIDPKTIHDIIPKLYDICRNPETKKWFNFEVKGIEMKVDFEIGWHWANLKNYDPDIDYTKLARLG